MAPFKMPMIMWNMTTFPIERLCFDLQLEILEQLEAKDVIELVKVNQGFQWMISNRPSMVFGHHVHEIQLYVERINIKRLNEWNFGLDVIRYFPFIKNIRLCNQLTVCDHGHDNPMNSDHAAFLKQLDTLNSLSLYYCAPQHLELLSHLSIKFKRYARLPSFGEEAPIKDLLGHFIEAQLNEYQIVRFGCKADGELQLYYNALIKTHIKYVGIECVNGDHIVPAIQRIVSHGVPSKNPAAVVKVSDDFVDGMKATIVVFLKGYPGMKQINGKNRQPFVALANDRLKGSGYPALTMKALCFRRNINATRDCIYMLSSEKINQASCRLDFYAFYIKTDELIDN